MRQWLLLILMFGFGGGMAASGASAESAEVAAMDAVESEAETVAKLLVDIGSDSADIRRRAALILGKYETDEALSALTAALADPESVVRRAALGSLLENDAPPVFAAEPILLMIIDPDVDIRRIVSSHLPALIFRLPIRMVGLAAAPGERRGFLTPAVARAVARAFGDEDESVRRNLAENFGMLANDLPASLLAPMLREQNREIRVLALRQIAGRLPSESMGILKPLADDSDEIVRLTLARSMRMAEDQTAADILGKLAVDGSPLVAGEANAGLMRLRLPVDWRRLRELVDGGALAPGLVADIFYQASRNYGASGLEFLRAALAGERPQPRAAALEAGAYNMPEIFNAELIAGYLDDPSPLVRAAAARVIRTADGVDGKILMAMAASPHPEIRLAAVAVARRTVAAAAQDALEELLLDNDVEVRAAALAEFARRGFDGWRELLVISLQDPNEEISSFARQLLGGEAAEE